MSARVRTDVSPTPDRLAAVLATGLRVGHGDRAVGAGLAPRTVKLWSRGGMPTEVKRDKDGNFVLTPQQLKDLMSSDLEDVDLSLRDVWKSMRPPPAPPAAPAPTPSADYAVPILLYKRQPRVRFSTDKYMIKDRDAARIYLKFTAASRLMEREYERFIDEAGAGGYGDVSEGDWQAAGIKVEDSHNYVVAKAVADPLETKWDVVQTSWRNKGFDWTDYGELYVHKKQYSDALDELYENYVREPMAESDSELTVSSLTIYINNFADAMLNGKFDDGDDEDDDE